MQTMTTAPKEINAYVKRLCNQLVGSYTGCIYLEPQNIGTPAECIGNVEKYIQQHGGSSQFGWRIWEWPNVLIEGELHCVWKAPDGKLIDITPAPDGENFILFLPDDRIKYKGQRIDNKRLAITNNPIVKDFFNTSKSVCEWLNTFGNKSIKTNSPAMIEFKMIHHLHNVQKKMLINGFFPKDKCLCFEGNTKPYKACCGKLA